MQPHKIFLVDDHPLIRERLVEVLQREADFVVCGEAEDRNTAFEAIQQAQPELVILDLTLKNSHGMDLLKDLRAINPDILVLVLSMQEEEVYAERCLRAGARGYVNKQQASRSIIGAVRTVLAGDVYLGESATRGVLARTLGAGRMNGAVEPVLRLTDRELQVYELVGGGHAGREIAERLGLDTKTVDTYKARIREKLGLREPSELLKHAIAWVQRKR